MYPRNGMGVNLMANEPILNDHVVKATHRHPISHDEFIAAQRDRPGEVWYFNGMVWCNGIKPYRNIFLGPVYKSLCDHYAIPIDYEFEPRLRVGDKVTVHGGEHAIVIVDEPDALGSIVVQMDQTDFYQLIHQSNVRKVN